MQFHGTQQYVSRGSWCATVYSWSLASSKGCDSQGWISMIREKINFHLSFSKKSQEGFWQLYICQVHLRPPKDYEECSFENHSQEHEGQEGE